METPTAQQIPINAFAGIFLAATGVGVLIISQDLVRSTLFLGVGLFFLMRALAQHRHGPDDTDDADGGN